MDTIFQDNKRIGLMLFTLALNILFTFIGAIYLLVLGRSIGQQVTLIIIFLLLAAGITMTSANPMLGKILPSAAFLIFGILLLVMFIKNIRVMFHGYTNLFFVLSSLCIIPEGLGVAVCAVASLLNEKFGSFLKYGALAFAVFSVLALFLNIFSSLYYVGIRFIFTFGTLLDVVSVLLLAALFGLIFLFSSDIV